MAVKVLGTQPLESPRVCPVEGRPEGLDAVCLHLTSHIIPDRVLDGAVIRQACVGRRIVSENLSPRDHAARDEVSQGLARCVRHHLCCDLVGGSVTDANDRHITDRSSTCQRLSLGGWYIPPNSTYPGFVNSTGPENRFFVRSPKARPTRWAKCQADFCVMPKSRWRFMLDTLLRLVATG